MEFDQNSLGVEILSDDSVTQIHGLEQQVHLTPWSVKTMRSCFANDLTEVFGCFYCRELIGYAILQIIKPEAELQNLAITKSFQRRGIGSYFLGELIRYCQRLSLEKIMLEVRESNQAAIELYQKNGFAKAGERRGYYQLKSTRELAWLMTKVL